MLRDSGLSDDKLPPRQMFEHPAVNGWMEVDVVAIELRIADFLSEAMEVVQPDVGQSAHGFEDHTGGYLKGPPFGRWIITE